MNVVTGFHEALSKLMVTSRGNHGAPTNFFEHGQSEMKRFDAFHSEMSKCKFGSTK